MKVKTLIIKLLLFSIPFCVLIALYFYLDPFKIVKHYDSYFESGKPEYISLDKDFVSTENWINHYPQYKYNSYIFGNSRSMYYQVDTWKDYIHEDSDKCYHFDASGESIFGIAKKIEFLHQQNVPIKNALLVMDNAVLNQAHNSAGHIFLKDPNISGQSKIAFQINCMQDFFDFKFMIAFLDFKMSGKVKDYMKRDFLLDDQPFFYNYVNNEIQQKLYEDMIAQNPEDYYGRKKGIFYLRDTLQQYANNVIKKDQLDLLHSIKKIFDEGGTKYKIVISPLYDQAKLNSIDLGILKQIFGDKNVYDFSGINEYTKSMYNYYETSHYRPKVASSIMQIIYGGSN